MIGILGVTIVNRQVHLWAALLASIFLTACAQPTGGGDEQSAADSEDGSEIIMVDGVKKKRIEGFGGII